MTRGAESSRCGLVLRPEARMTHRYLMLLGLAALGTANVSAQVCDVPDAIRSAVPTDPVPEMPYVTQWVTGSDEASFPLGVGHLHYSYENQAVELPPAATNWLRWVVLPISSTAGSPPTVWIVDGWVLREGAAPRPWGQEALVETGYEEVSLVVLDARADGWLRIRYDVGAGSEGTGWTPSCALSAGSAVLTFSRWSEWLVNEQINGRISPLFFRSGIPGPLYRGPSAGDQRLEDIDPDYILYPVEVRGDWMRVKVAEPADYCELDVMSNIREGWVRWYRPESGPAVWYFTRGC
ncbi:MAG: hypothetical protein OEZ65_12230 [Gemmatimonadota bacterium]|nr:hypothetical protein [Gemmatimonadota bacterium]